MNVGIYVYDDAEVLDFAGPFEVFSTASRLDPALGLTVFLVAEHGDPVRARNGFRVLPHYTISDHPAIDVLLVAGGVHMAEMGKDGVIGWISRQAATATWVTSVCTGAFLLARARLLDGRRVTTHWEDIADLEREFPALDVVAESRWVEDGNRLTSAGIAAGIDMSLYLVSRLGGAELARRTARQMDYPWIAVST
jgi:transcriptional regulator GlxA family with amidase domain